MEISPLLEMRNVTKIYSNGVLANSNVNFSLEKGEIHAIVGENGAGKSTLMKMIFGLEEPSEGEIYLNGKKVKFQSPQDAIDHGIGMVHQHFMLVPSFSVVDNIILGMEPIKGFNIDYKDAVRMTVELSAKYNLAIEPLAKIEDLSVGMKQKVEILKVLIRGANILILDEPTAVLTPQETEELFRELLGLKREGHTIVFISHKLKEVKEICDRITIMRAGKTEGVFQVADVTEQEISRLMVGRDVILKYDKTNHQPGSPVLRVEHVSYAESDAKPLLNNISFTIREGEIVGIAGVEGNGQAELIKALTGQISDFTGHVAIGEHRLQGHTMKEIRDLGMSYIPEDRMHQGTAADASISDNLISRFYRFKAWNKGLFLNKKKITEFSEEQIKRYKVRCSGPEQLIGMLSGGNMQKIVVARECDDKPKLLIAEQPTRGVDVGAAQLIHQRLLEMRQEGCAILLLSADLNEILEVSDSLLVMYNGQFAAYFPDAKQVKEEDLGFAMLGLKRHNEDQIRRAIHV
ncbi:ABC transporter ATP-binding protein [Paenibacillus selenitireducens]|uniref:ABC transporter ATP-binding protein n=1 Tax=Paenibacillus selenitireducens TaxID=1324314 RepID=A0A1T2XL63_9BACL|nr:ABC transporter ATP-binding protein [Paenibacillus selenitireducens]OPA80403.1 ABC transporter ATP-binding protein [Paenibacillus selenitireducens]